MPTRGQKTYFAAADILRVFAIAVVGWYHIWQQSWLDPGFRIGSAYVNLQQAVRHGYMLVDVLLVVSGFLLVLPYLKKDPEDRPSARSFYLKRFWRIVPSYALAVLLVFFLYALPEGAYSSPGSMIKDLFTHLTFTHNLFYDTYFRTPLPIVLWTMGVEVQFYLLFPLVVRFFEEAPKLTCLTLAVIAFVYRVWAYRLPDTTFWVNQLPGMLDLYACGMFAAHVYSRLFQREVRRYSAAVCVFLCLVSFCLLCQILYLQPVGDYEEMRRGQLMYRLPIGLLCGVFLLCGGLCPKGIDRIWGNPVTRFLSAISYNFYIWHQFIAVRLKQVRFPPYASDNPSMAGEQPWQTVYTLLCFAAAVIIAAILTYFWERPVNRWGLKRSVGMNKETVGR